MQCKVVDDECASGWKFLNHTKKCYKHFNSPVFWEEARHLCQNKVPNKDGDLASVPDKITNDFLNEILNGISRGVLIGGYKDSVNGQWKWSDGTPFTWTANFIQDLNNELLILRTNYRVIEHGVGTWKDTKTISSAAYICQYDAGMNRNKKRLL